MSFEPSAVTQTLRARLEVFYDEHIYPNEKRHAQELRDMRAEGKGWQVLPVIEELKVKARQAGLWNLFLPHAHEQAPGISNLDYAPLCEVMGRVIWATWKRSTATPLPSSRRIGSSPFSPEKFDLPF
jgi:acyl-CoA dehydrogenase